MFCGKSLTEAPVCFFTIYTVDSLADPPAPQMQPMIIAGIEKQTFTWDFYFILLTFLCSATKSYSLLSSSVYSTVLRLDSHSVKNMHVFHRENMCNLHAFLRAFFYFDVFLMHLHVKKNN